MFLSTVSIFTSKYIPYLQLLLRDSNLPISTLYKRSRLTSFHRELEASQPVVRPAVVVTRLDLDTQTYVV